MWSQYQYLLCRNIWHVQTDLEWGLLIPKKGKCQLPLGMPALSLLGQDIDRCITWFQITWQIVERNQSLHKFLDAYLQWNWNWYSESLVLSTVFKIEHKLSLLILVRRTK